MSITSISKPIALAVAALAPTASAQPSPATSASPTAVKYYYNVRQIRLPNVQCTAQLDAKKTAPGHWFVRATFRKNTDGGMCSYYLWRNKGSGEYGPLSHGILQRDKRHQTAWYWDGPRYHVIMHVDNTVEAVDSEPY